MYRKLTFVISILILSLSIAYLGASAETDEDEIFEINLTFVSSGEEFYVPQGDKIVFKTRW